MGKFRVDTLGKIASVGRGVYLRTGSWNPLTNLNGFLGTRGTRSNEGPDIIQKEMSLDLELPYKRWFIFIWCMYQSSMSLLTLVEKTDRFDDVPLGQNTKSQTLYVWAIYDGDIFFDHDL